MKSLSPMWISVVERGIMISPIWAHEPRHYKVAYNYVMELQERASVDERVGDFDREIMSGFSAESFCSSSMAFISSFTLIRNRGLDDEHCRDDADNAQRICCRVSRCHFVGGFGCSSGQG